MIKDYIKFPQRKIKKNYRSVTGHFPSLKNGKSIGFESLLEKILFLVIGILMMTLFFTMSNLK